MNEEYEDPRLAAIYDVLDPDRSDLDPYLAFAETHGARTALDLGCGTGVFALQLAARGLDVIGVDLAVASLDVARAKPGADAVRWIVGDASAILAERITGVDLITLTANAAMAITTDTLFTELVVAASAALTPGGHLVFETRRPDVRAWEGWTRDATYTEVDDPRAGRLASWAETVGVRWPAVDVRNTFVVDGEEIVSDSTLRYRDLDDLRTELEGNGFALADVLDAPDRPGREWILVARRT